MCIVLRTAPGTDLYAVRHHLRRFLRVIGADGKAMFFRFYDPRAFRVVIPTLGGAERRDFRSEEHTSELQSLMRISYAVFCLKKTTDNSYHTNLQQAV